LHKITCVEVLDRYRLALIFADGTHGTVDLGYLVGSGVFALWRNYDAFRQVKIGDAGELTWSDQVDLCPDSLYLRVTGNRPEDVFPSLRQETCTF
jgi:hypothetical protein